VLKGVGLVMGEGVGQVIVGVTLEAGGPPLDDPPGFPPRAAPEHELRIAAKSAAAAVSRTDDQHGKQRMAISLG
jgi:hypothetical protein